MVVALALIIDESGKSIRTDSFYHCLVKSRWTERRLRTERLRPAVGTRIFLRTLPRGVRSGCIVLVYLRLPCVVPFLILRKLSKITLEGLVLHSLVVFVNIRPCIRILLQHFSACPCGSGSASPVAADNAHSNAKLCRKLSCKVEANRRPALCRLGRSRRPASVSLRKVEIVVYIGNFLSIVEPHVYVLS